MVERALILCGTGPLKAEHFPVDVQKTVPAQGEFPAPTFSAGPLTPAVEEFEAKMIERALAEVGGSKPRAASLLDISERSLWYKLKKYFPKEHE